MEVEEAVEITLGFSKGADGADGTERSTGGGSGGSAYPRYTVTYGLVGR